MPGRTRGVGYVRIYLGLELAHRLQTVSWPFLAVQCPRRVNRGLSLKSEERHYPTRTDLRYTGKLHTPFWEV